MFYVMHYYLYFVQRVSHRERESERERGIGREAGRDSQKAGRNKDEGIGVGGWTIRRDHPSRVRSPGYNRCPPLTPFHFQYEEVLLE